MMRVELAETGSAQVALSAEQGRRLAASEIVTATPSPFDPRLWDVAARGKVGVALVDDVELWIAPKLPIDRLLFLVGYAADPRG